jgi:hypothetical protein
MKENIFSVISIFAILIVIIYVIYNLINVKIKEGMKGNLNIDLNSHDNGVTDKADVFASKIKSTNIKKQDKLLINKYKQNYEQIILNMDDLINTLMLEKLLYVNVNNKGEMMETLKDINSLSESKNNLNTIIKFVDSQ